MDVEAVKVTALRKMAATSNPRRGDNRVRLGLYNRVTAGGRNRCRGIRGVGVECSCVVVRFRGGRGPFSVGMRVSPVEGVAAHLDAAVVVVESAVVGVR